MVRITRQFQLAICTDVILNPQPPNFFNIFIGV